MTEGEMRLKVVAWLFERGFEVCHECGLMNNCDLVGFRFHPRIGRSIPNVESVCAVELKVSKFADVFVQAQRNQGKSTESWVAMDRSAILAARAGTIQRFISAGIGMLAVHHGGLYAVTEASTNKSATLAGFQKWFWHWHLHPQEHGRGSRGN